MHVVHVTDRVSERGGADVHLLGVIERQRARGHAVTVIAGRDDGTHQATFVRVLVPGLHDGDTSRLDALAEGADVVHVHNALHPAVLSWAAQRGAVATVQDHRSFCPGQGKLTLLSEPCTVAMHVDTCAGCFDDAGYHRRIHDVTARRRDALRGMRALTVLSDYMRRELVQVGVAPELIHVIPPFVRELDVNAVANGPPCVLFVGRLVAAKGARDAALAHARSGVALPLVFAGTGTLRNELETRHEVLGWQTHANMSAVYRRARAVLMPSRWQEPYGIAGIEALSMGVPVVAYASGGITEWHPGGAWLVPWGDVDALAVALRDAVEHAAPPWVAPNPEHLADALERVYLTGMRAGETPSAS